MTADARLLSLLSAGPPGETVAVAPDGRRTDRAALRGRVAALAESVVERPGERWAVVCDDALEFAVGLFAVLAAGRQPIVPQNPRPGSVLETAGELDGLICDHDWPEASVPVFDTAAGTSESAVPEPEGPDRELVLYTSGSTGHPKAVTKRTDQLLSEVRVLEACWGDRIGGATVVGTVPHFHIYGLLFRVLWPLYGRRPLFTEPVLEPSTIAGRIRGLGGAALVSSPAHLSRVPDFGILPRGGDGVRVLFSSAGALAPATRRRINEELGLAPVEIYGSTETGGIAWRRVAPGDPETWHPLPGVECRIDDDGELFVRSPHIHDGGPWATGDLARAADAGFDLLGRKDDVVKIEDKRISLSQLVRHLEAHPLVSEAAVVPLSGRRRIIGAAVVLTEEGRRRLETEGRRRIRQDIETGLLRYFEPIVVPRKWRFEPALPRNASGKIERGGMEALFRESVG